MLVLICVVGETSQGDHTLHLSFDPKVGGGVVTGVGVAVDLHLRVDLEFHCHSWDPKRGSGECAGTVKCLCNGDFLAFVA